MSQWMLSWGGLLPDLDQGISELLDILWWYLVAPMPSSSKNWLHTLAK